jgi:hypothetical protein
VTSQLDAIFISQGLAQVVRDSVETVTVPGQVWGHKALTWSNGSALCDWLGIRERTQAYAKEQQRREEAEALRQRNRRLLLAQDQVPKFRGAIGSLENNPHLSRTLSRVKQVGERVDDMSKSLEKAKEQLEDAAALMDKTSETEQQAKFGEVNALGLRVELNLLQAEDLLAEGGGGECTGN